jgi:hypothetical protein
LERGVSPKTFRLFTMAEGAEGHCEGMAPTVFWGAAYNWLDTILARQRLANWPSQMGPLLASVATGRAVAADHLCCREPAATISVRYGDGTQIDTTTRDLGVTFGRVSRQRRLSIHYNP